MIKEEHKPSIKDFELVSKPVYQAKYKFYADNSLVFDEMIKQLDYLVQRYGLVVYSGGMGLGNNIWHATYTFETTETKNLEEIATHIEIVAKRHTASIQRVWPQ